MLVQSFDFFLLSFLAFLSIRMTPHRPQKIAGNVWRGLLAFAKLRGWVLPAVPTAAASPTPPPQPQRQLRELTGLTELMRLEWEESESTVPNSGILAPARFLGSSTL